MHGLARKERLRDGRYFPLSSSRNQGIQVTALWHNIPGASQERGETTLAKTAGRSKIVGAIGKR
jgi:hypothetical protein